MKNELKRLIEFTKECRFDMHEPDEQGLKARVIGDHLDNACGNRIDLDAIEKSYQEYVVVLEKGTAIERFNLATLIALARLAKFPNT